MTASGLGKGRNAQESPRNPDGIPHVPAKVQSRVNKRASFDPGFVPFVVRMLHSSDDVDQPFYDVLSTPSKNLFQIYPFFHI